MTNETCTNTPVGVTLRVIGGKWKLLILWHVKDKPIRFGKLMKEMRGITQKMLTQQLRELEADALVKRNVYAEIPPRVDYVITDYGKTLEPVLESLSLWGENHIEKNK